MEELDFSKVDEIVLKWVGDEKLDVTVHPLDVTILRMHAEIERLREHEE